MKQIHLKQLREGTYQADFNGMMGFLVDIQKVLGEKQISKMSAEFLGLILGKMVDGSLTYEQIKPANMLLNQLDYEVVI